MKLFTKSILALACLTGMVSAGTLRASPSLQDQDPSIEEPSNSTHDDRELTSSSSWNGQVFYLQSYGAWKHYRHGSEHYLGYNPADQQAWIQPGKYTKFVYTEHHQLAEYDDHGKTGKCLLMGHLRKTLLVSCKDDKDKQKWLITADPKDDSSGYYTIKNQFHGWALMYNPHDTAYYLHAQDWSTIDHHSSDGYNDLLFYKEAAYTKYRGKACRTGSDTQGKEGRDYDKYEHKNADSCQKICDKNDRCKGWEYQTSGRCEIWYNEPKKFSHKSGFDCYVREYY